MTKGMEIVHKHISREGFIPRRELLADYIDCAIAEASQPKPLAGLDQSDVATLVGLARSFVVHHDTRLSEECGYDAKCGCIKCNAARPILARLPK